MGRNRPWKRNPHRPGGNYDAAKPTPQQQPNQSTSRDRSMAGQQQNRQGNRAGRGGGQNAASGNAWPGGEGAKREAPTTRMPQDEHIPVNNFNSDETKEFLKQGMGCGVQFIREFWLIHCNRIQCCSW
jgi:hypothetical protein